MIGYAIETLTFEEELVAPVPACLEIVASACWVGFRLVPAPQPCLENVVIGCKRLPQFRDARRASLRHEMRWHFRARKVSAFGDTFGVRAWQTRYESDAALRRTVTEHPNYPKWKAGLLQSYRAQPLVALAIENGRSCYGRFHGDEFMLSSFHRMMEEGF
jgi:hypothetical protein